MKAPTRTLLVGLAAGVVSGLLGVGGGVVLVPGLVLACALPQHRAHATSLAAIIPIGATGALLFGLHGEIHFLAAALIVLGAVAGAPVGVRFMSSIPERWLRLLFIATALAAGVRLLMP